ncbi:MAG TPA: hypothetical protein VLF94_07115 [Chlamydiales bacterium]|nr:hypothetical protein [Chlamydiales bacterium]
MNKKYLLAACTIVLACSCQSKSDEMPKSMPDDSQKKEQSMPSKCGSCEMEKPKVAPVAEPVKTPAVVPQTVTSVTPEAKVETKAP